jgi:signal transduction histidine kinase
MFSLSISLLRENNKLLTFLILPWILMVSFGIPSYINNLWLLPRYFVKRRYVIYFLLFSLLVVLTATGSYYITHLVNTINPDCRYMGGFRNASLPGHAFPSLVFIMALAGGKFTADAITNQRKLEHLEKQKLEGVLESLKLQISPHFIFNSLNTIYGLSRKNNQVASEAIVKLSDILRYILYDCDNQNIRIQQEIDFLEQYIDFARLRSRSNARINFVVSHDKESQHIAPLLLLPIIENAIKHGLAKQIERPWITARLDIKEKRLDFCCANSNNNKEAISMNTSSGIGLKNVKRRLQLIYPVRHELIIEETGDVYRVQLYIELG